MQLNKQIIIIMLLGSMLFSAIASALYFYNKNKMILEEKSELVTIYVAKDDIPKETLITIDHLAQTSIEKQYILNKPLIQNEIIGKYNNERIYKNEIFLKQKLDTEIQKEQKNILEFEKSAYNIKFELFKNPNYALQQGEYINIISVYPLGEADSKGRFSNFSTNYVAPNIKVLGFIRDGRYEEKSITKHKVKKIINKNVEEVEEEIKADELVLDIDLTTLLRLVKDYNLGTQLWMTKTKYSNEYLNESKSDKAAENLIIKQDKLLDTIESAKKYEYVMYKPNKNVVQKSALIDYSNNKEESKTKNVDIILDSHERCKTITDKFIVGTKNTFYIRSEPSKDSFTKKTLNKNTIIPFIEKQADWYKTCDDNYINEVNVSEVNSTFVKEKLGKNE